MPAYPEGRSLVLLYDASKKGMEAWQDRADGVSSPTEEGAQKEGKAVLISNLITMPAQVPRLCMDLGYIQLWPGDMVFMRDRDGGNQMDDTVAFYIWDE